MSSNQSYSYSSTSYSSYSSSSNDGSGQPRSQKYTEQSSSNDRDGTTTQRRYEETGKPAIEEITQLPASGRQIGRGAVGSDRRIEDVSDEQAQRDREYEERMEDEYAKREGGA